MEPLPIAHGRKFRVRAVNDIGPSEWSKGSEILNCRDIFPPLVVVKKNQKKNRRSMMNKKK